MVSIWRKRAFVVNIPLEGIDKEGYGVLKHLVE